MGKRERSGRDQAHGEILGTYGGEPFVTVTTARPRLPASSARAA